MQRVASIVRSPRSAPVGQTSTQRVQPPHEVRSGGSGASVERGHDLAQEHRRAQALARSGSVCLPIQPRPGARGERALGQRRGVARDARARRARQRVDPSRERARAAPACGGGSRPTRRRPRRGRGRGRSRGGGRGVGDRDADHAARARQQRRRIARRARRRPSSYDQVARSPRANAARMRCAGRRVGRGARDAHRVRAARQRRGFHGRARSARPAQRVGSPPRRFFVPETRASIAAISSSLELQVAGGGVLLDVRDASRPWGW